MPKKDYIVVGKTLTAHGIKGWIAIKSYTHPEENIFKYDLYIKKKDHFQKLDIVEHRIMSQKIVMKIESTDTINNAKEYFNYEIFTLKEDLPIAAVDEYYWHQLIGCKVFNENNLEIGLVDSIFPTKSNDVLVIKKSQQGSREKEILIPFIKDYIIKVSKEENTIIVKWKSEF